MPRPSPLHPRTSALCTSLAWKEWAGYAAVCTFDRHSEREYFAFRQSAGLLDVSPLYKYDIRGRDAAAMLARVWTRDIQKLPPGRVVYGCMCDPDGFLMDDGTVACLEPGWYRMTSSESWFAWLLKHARGFDVDITDTSADIAALALQGPRARAILNPLVDIDLDAMRFFGVSRGTLLGGLPVTVSRTGYTGDLGFEIWTDNEHACDVWDALIEEGHPHGIEPVGLDALDVARLEAGFVLQGVDYISSRSCIVESRKSTPEDAGLGWTVKTDRSRFVGQRALIAEGKRGPEWAMVGLVLDWAELEDLYAEYNLPPHLAPEACRLAVPVFDGSGSRQIGQVTSSTWSPTLKKYIALAQVRRRHGVVGTRLRVEHTPEFERRQVTATVVQRPFFDPPRKTFTPAAPPKQGKKPVGGAAKKGAA